MYVDAIWYEPDDASSRITETAQEHDNELKGVKLRIPQNQIHGSCGLGGGVHVDWMKLQ